MLRTSLVARFAALLSLFLAVMALTPLWAIAAPDYATSAPAIDQIMINEVDAETLGTDTVEFVELYDGGSGNTSLDGLFLVFFNGQDDTSYRTFELSGLNTNSDGYFILGNNRVPGVDFAFADNVLQNGPDAVALYVGEASSYPNGTAVSTTNLLDALVYDTDDPDDPGLLILLQAGEPQVDENGRDFAEDYSNQRCPNGSGGQRNTQSYWQDYPTPKASNKCVPISDDAPQVLTVAPEDKAQEVAVDANIVVTFSEEVVVSAGWTSISCSSSGSHAAAMTGDGTLFTLNPQTDFMHEESCTVTISAALVTDADSNDPPDQMAEDFVSSFTTRARPVASHMLINEVDVDTPGTDTAEFVELFDGGTGSTALDGVVAVFYNGGDDRSYRAIDLDGQITDDQGYFVLGSTGTDSVDLIIPDGALQNGADAVAIYSGDSSDFPQGTAVTSTNLLDALVYDTDDPNDPGLLILLQVGELQVDEAGRGSPTADSNQRCPNGSGGQRRSSTYLQNLPTPKATNNCILDDAPEVLETSPADGTGHVARDAALSVKFSEAVQVTPASFELDCSASGGHSLAISGGPVQYTVTPASSFNAGESCTARVVAAEVGDEDTADPPHQMNTDFVWTFGVEALPVATHILINEVDADTPGTDTAEFVELFDGGTGSTALDGLVVVFYNGGDDTSYRAIDLDGQITDDQGYFVLGSAGAGGVDLITPDGAMQNGADAIALYSGDSGDFPQGTAVSTSNLLDALVYDTNDPDDPGLLILLQAGEPQVDEAGRGSPTADSNQRCPNGSGGQRRSSTYLQNLPTPKATNNCILDDAPEVLETSPADGTGHVARDAALSVKFSEAVQVTPASFELDCSASGGHSLAISGGPIQYTVTPASGFNAGESCTARVVAAEVGDEDTADPPHQMITDFVWTFTAEALPVATHILINEVDADTPGSDKAEFIELYDGGGGGTMLDGLVIVLYNGSSDTSYRAFDLDGQKSDGSGYFVVGNGSVPNIDLAIPDGVMQNGADAVAIYAANSSDFPNGTAVIHSGLLDALVYDTDDGDDVELLDLLQGGQPQVNEAGRGNKELDGNQRCPNGSGGQRVTAGYMQNPPTPGASNDCTLDAAPLVESTTPSDGASDVALDSDLTINFSEPVELSGEWFGITCSQSLGHTADASGGPRQFTLDPHVNFETAEACTATLFSEQIKDLDGLPDSLPADYSWTFTSGIPKFGVCGDPTTAISAIQGKEQISPLAGAQGVLVEGIVVGDFQGEEALGGFFLQEEASDQDADPLSSEAIFIHEMSQGADVTTGQRVRVQGDVSEIEGLTSLSNLSGLLSCGAGSAMEPTALMLPVPNLDQWEAVEGMYLSLPQTLAITSNANLGRDGSVDLSLDGRLFYPTEVAETGAAALTVADLNRRSRITLDDGSKTENPLPLPPFLGQQNTLRAGDTVGNLTGILAEDGSGYRFHPTQPVLFTRINEREPAPVRVNAILRVAVLHTGDYFNGDGLGAGFPGTRGAQTAVEFARQRSKMIRGIVDLNADVLGLLALENDGYETESALQDLVDGLNEAALSGTSYAFVKPAVNQLGSSDLAVGFVYRQETVSPLGSAVTIDSPPFNTFKGQPLAQAFAAAGSGEQFVAAVTHWQERGNCPAAGDPNADQNDGQGCWNGLRSEAAHALVAWLDTDPTGSADADILILGDLNAYSREDPLKILGQAGTINLTDRNPGSSYTSNVDGESGTLIHAFASPTLAAQTDRVALWHINADEPQALDYRMTNQPALYTPDAYRSSSDDPLVIDLILGPVQTAAEQIFLPLIQTSQ